MLNRISGANDFQDENWIANDLKIIEEEQQSASDFNSARHTVLSSQLLLIAQSWWYMDNILYS